MHTQIYLQELICYSYAYDTPATTIFSRIFLIETLFVGFCLPVGRGQSAATSFFSTFSVICTYTPVLLAQVTPLWIECCNDMFHNYAPSLRSSYPQFAVVLEFATKTGLILSCVWSLQMAYFKAGHEVLSKELGKVLNELNTEVQRWAQIYSACTLHDWKIHCSVKIQHSK